MFNNGFILQWNAQNATGTSGRRVTLTFAVAFTTTYYNVIKCPLSTAHYNGYYGQTSDRTLTSCKMVCSANISNYIIIGF